tara:strand:+ start:49 stop:936 length:888 start_codon:yes stop_codon:yes gene_type:complete
MAKGKGKNKNKNKGKSNKQKVQKYIRKILSDGKVSKSEVRKAQKKGIRLDRISKAARKSTQPGNVFSQQAASPFKSKINPADYFKRGGGQPSGPPGLYPQAKAPTPAAPVIRPGAQTLIDRDQARRAALQVRGIGTTEVRPATGGDGAGATDPEVNPLQGDLDAALGRIGELEGQLAEMPDFESIFARQAEEAAAQRAQDMQDLQMQQQRYMEEMEARRAEMERERQLTFRTSQQNAARAGMRPDFRIGAQAARDRLGTGGFKRRRKAMKAATIAQGILPAAAAASNATGNLLNV